MATEIALKWSLAKLRELGEFRNGANFRQSDYGVGYPIVNVKNLYGGRYASVENLKQVNQEAVPSAASLALSRGDILFARSSVMASGAGQAAMVDLCQPNTIFSGFIIRFRVTDMGRALPGFLNYLLRSPAYRELLTRIASGTTITNLSQATLGALEVNLPPLSEQRAIAKLLGTLDDKIELNRRMNETLEAMARAIFKSWLVDFDPVHAKAEGRQLYGMEAETAALFPDSFDDSCFGKIPKGWKVDEIRAKANSIQYGLTRSAATDPVGPRFLRITDIQGGRVDWSQVPFCPVSAEEQQKYRICRGDILVARTGASTGENIYIIDAPDAVFASYLVRIQFADLSLARVVGEYMRTAAYFDYVAGAIGGSAQPNASAQVLASAAFVFPPICVAKRFAKLIERFDRQRVENSRQIETLTSIRDALLPKLISGELRVQNITKPVEMR
jgi:type I restriction enzyme S subunit